MFCTNGVLLRMLTHGDGLGDITHVWLRLPRTCPLSNMRTVLQGRPCLQRHVASYGIVED